MAEIQLNSRADVRDDKKTHYFVPSAAVTGEGSAASCDATGPNPTAVSDHTDSLAQHPVSSDPQLEAAVLEAGENPARAAELAAELGIGGESPTRAAAGPTPHYWSIDLVAAMDLATIEPILEEYTEGLSRQHTDIGLFADSLRNSEEIALIREQLERDFLEAGWQKPAVNDAGSQKSVEFGVSVAAAQLLRCGYLALLGKLPTVRERPVEYTPAPGTEVDDENNLLTRWYIDPSSETLQSAALKRALELESDDEYAQQALITHLTFLSSAPAYGKLLSDLREPNDYPGWGQAMFAARCFSAGIIASAMAERTTRIRDVAALCIGQGSHNLLIGLLRDDERAGLYRGGFKDVEMTEQDKVAELVDLMRTKIRPGATNLDAYTSRGYWNEEHVDKALKVALEQDGYSDDGKGGAR